MKTALSTQIEPAWTLERHAQVAGEIGYDALEVVLGPPHAEATEVGENADCIAGLLREHGLDIACVTGTNPLDGSEATETAACQAIEVAARLGCPTVKIASARPSSRAATDEDFTRCAGALQRCCREALAAGVVLTVETHLNMLTDTLAGTERLLEETGASPAALGVTYDITNVYTARDDVVAGVDLLREWIRLVHVKDGRLAERGIEWCPVGLGEVDLLGALRRLDEAGYDGYVSVECLLSAGAYARPPTLATAEAVARHDFEALRGLLEQL